MTYPPNKLYLPTKRIARQDYKPLVKIDSREAHTIRYGRFYILSAVVGHAVALRLCGASTGAFDTQYLLGLHTAA